MDIVQQNRNTIVLYSSFLEIGLDGAWVLYMVTPYREPH